MVAAATLFALLKPAPPGGPEGLMGVADFFKWLFAMVVVSLIGAPVAITFIGRLAEITPPPLGPQITGGHWLKYGAKAYARGAAAALLGAALFGSAAFPLAFIAGGAVARNDTVAYITGAVGGAVAGVCGAVWCGRRAIWSVIVADLEDGSDAGGGSATGPSP